MKRVDGVRTVQKCAQEIVKFRSGSDTRFLKQVEMAIKMFADVIVSKLCIIDLQVLSDAIFFGLGNLGMKVVAMSYEMSLCFGSTQPEQATDVRRTDRTSKHA